MNRLADAYELGRAVETIRSTALQVGKALCDALAHDTMLAYSEPEPPESIDGLPFLDDVRVGDQAATWYRVRSSDVLVAYIHGMLHHEFRVYRSGVQIDDGGFAKRFRGEPIWHAIELAPDWFRRLT